MSVLRKAGHDPQVLGHLDLAAAVCVAAEDKELAAGVHQRRFQQHVAHGLAGEEGQIIVGGWTALVPGRLAEGRHVRGHDDVRILCCRSGQHALQVRRGLIAQGVERPLRSAELVQRVLVAAVFPFVDQQEVIEDHV